ncbi:MAG: zinc-ribbon domain-containing protein [Candidatus Saccharibacteria bacterium]|nr:zinc-ribbon domain-containing protein [Candidatus Saccharibacteria bacterium]
MQTVVPAIERNALKEELMTSYISDNSDLIKDWDFDKNARLNLFPNRLTTGSGKKVWWKCEKGHSYASCIYNRASGKKCPYCSNRMVLPGFNDLQTLYPSVAKEWDYDKNQGSPKQVIPGTTRKVWFVCPQGHSYYISLHGRCYRGDNCPYCSGKKVKYGYNDLTTMAPQLLAEWDYELNEKDGIDPKLIYYKTNKKVNWVCKECGHKWKTQPSLRLQGIGCPECGKKKAVFKRRQSLLAEQGSLAVTNPNLLKEWNYEKNTAIRPESITAGSSLKVWWKCEKCGHEWKANINSRAKNNTGCIKCAGVQRKTNDEFINELHSINSNIIVLNEYKNARSKLHCKCATCGHIWDTDANHLISQKSGCPQCANNHRNDSNKITQEDFEKRVRDKNPTMTVLGKYKDAHSRIKMKCNICGNIWNPLAWDIVTGRNGCPQCSHTSTSFMEQFILLSLKEALGDKNVVSRDKQTIGKELDIYVPILRLAIEPGSWFWHKDKIEEDNTKRKLCNEKNIDLFIIYDACPNDCESTEGTLHYSIDLASEKDHMSLKEIVRKILKKHNIEHEFSRSDWDRIARSAYLKSRMMTTTDFKQQLYEINPVIDVIGEYTGNHNKIQCRCKICDYLWSNTPGHLLSGQSCPKCAGRRKRTNSEFIEDLLEKQPNLTPLDTFKNTSIKIRVKCNTCGNIWESKPANLLSGFGCPKCARERIRKIHSKKVYQYSLNGELINEFESLSDAQKSTGILKTSICNVCNGLTKTAGGYIWSYTELK